MQHRKKLIEVALPLEAINRESAREKSIRHGHPSTLHLWWARRPLAAARAVIWASLVDDPSALPGQFPTEEAQDAERVRLFGILERLVRWESSNDPEVLAEARAEILKSTGGNPPALLDPFAGGGAIPLEAQRLGLAAHAADLNPVAVMINKAMIELPPRFAGRPPVNPTSRGGGHQVSEEWAGAQGLAADVRHYGEWMKRRAFKKIGHLYPKVKDENGQDLTVIAWIWARTVRCPNPACGRTMPLASSFELSKKKGREAYVRPVVEGKGVRYEVGRGPGAPEPPKVARGANFRCIGCGEASTSDYIKEEAKAGRMGAAMMAIAAEGAGGRAYLPPDAEQVAAAQVEKPDECPDGELPNYPRAFTTSNYGMSTFSSLFTNRQLVALATFSGLVAEAREQIIADGGDEEYARAVAVYLAFVVSKLTDYHSAICTWHSTRETIGHTFGLPVVSMKWDYAEANLFSSSTGSFDGMLDWVAKCIRHFPAGPAGSADQRDARADRGPRDAMVSTDPPYYDNIGYADLSDFFYVWLRPMLKGAWPDLFRTMLVPKAEELIAAAHRFDGGDARARANEFFEGGMLRAFGQIHACARADVPVTVYYAFKQSEAGGGETASTGWETMLTALIQAGFAITGTWPMRTELANRTRGMDSNALASSIVLVCRKRPADAPASTRRDFIAALRRELRPALRELLKSSIAPVDLAQSAIGPGMAVYSRHSRVLDAAGAPMGVRAALQAINRELDAHLVEQDGDLDAESRFCVDLYSQRAFGDVRFGEADVLARAKNTSVERLAARGLVRAQKGSARLLTRDEIQERPDGRGQAAIWLLAQQLTRAMEAGGIAGAARIVAGFLTSEPERARALAYRLFTIAERQAWAQEAFAYNSLVAAWPEVLAAAADLLAPGADAKENAKAGTKAGTKAGAGAGAGTRAKARPRQEQLQERLLDDGDA